MNEMPIPTSWSSAVIAVLLSVPTLYARAAGAVIRRICSVFVKCLPVLVAACAASTPPAPSAAPRTAEGALRVLVTQLSDRGTAAGPVVGARVCAAPARGEERCAETDREGVVMFRLARAVYSVRTEGPERARWMPDQRTADLIGGDAAVWVGLSRRIRLTGVIRDEDSKPVARADACAYPTGSDPPICAHSNDGGVYVIEARAGVYRLHVDGPPGGKLVSQWVRERPTLESADVFDTRAADATGIDVTLARGFVLRGTVRLSGATVEDAQVCTKSLAGPLPWDCERTDKRGGYAVLREPGPYWVWVVPPDRVRAVPVWYDRGLTGVEASPYGLVRDSTLDMTLIVGPQVRGKVRASTGEPVADVLVCVDTPFTTGRICRPSGADGAYAVTTRPEQYIVSVIPPADSDFIAEYWSHKRDWTEADRIRLTVSDYQLDLVLARGVVVKGMVKDTRGVPIAGATLYLDDASGIAGATDTDTSGSFRMAVRPGKYTLHVSPPFTVPLVGSETAVDASGSVETDIVLADVNL